MPKSISEVEERALIVELVRTRSRLRLAEKLCMNVLTTPKWLLPKPLQQGRDEWYKDFHAAGFSMYEDLS